LTAGALRGRGNESGSLEGEPDNESFPKVVTVTDISSAEIQKPLNWQDFQRCCVPLFRNLIRDPLLQEWGREGQDQQGIDLLGLRDGDPKQPVGIQCKRIADPITEKMIREDINRAKKLKPDLTELIFATTSDRDLKIQAVAAQITQELHDSGWPCRVTVMGWQDLRLEIVRFADALDAFLPSGRVFEHPTLQQVRHTEASIHAKMDAQTALIMEKLEGLSRSRTVFREEYDAELEPEAQSEPIGLHTEITTYRNVIRKGQTKIALEELARLLTRDPPPYARYRILSNISAIHLNASRCAPALDFSRQALTLRPNDVNARTNLAFAELVNGDRDGAVRRAQAILADHPSHGAAASALLQARAKDGGVSDPFALVPAETHGTVEFKVAAVVFLRQHDDASWRQMAAEATVAHPDNELLRRFAAEAELEPILNDAETMLGKQVRADVVTTVTRCAAVLKAIWTKEIAAEEISPDEIIPLAANLASAYRYAGDDAASADVLDQTMAKAGKDPILLRARALLYLHADNDRKAVELLAEAKEDPEARLFAAQVLAAEDPDRALERLEGLDPKSLPRHLQPVVSEIRALIAIVKKDRENLRAAIEQHGAAGGPFAVRAMLKARGHELGLLEDGEPKPDVTSTKPVSDAEFENLSDIHPLPAHVKELISSVREHEAELSFVDRLQIAQYLDNHNVFDVASDLLVDRVQLDKDTVGLRTYLSSSIGAHLAARAQTVIDAIPAGVAAKPFYQRMAATHYWNSGDAKSAAPLIEATYLASPAKLHLLLWYIDSLIREGRKDRIRELLQACDEGSLEGTVAQKSQLVRAFASFGQRERALKLAYRGFVLNRNTPAAWMGLMSVMLTEEDLQGLDLLSEVIGQDHSFDVQFEDGSKRRYLIEGDEAVRNVEHEALPLDHAVAKAVQGLKPDDKLIWPLGGAQARITAAKNKYLDAFHTAMARYNERFPDAKGFRQISVKTEGDEAFAELKAELIARSEYVIAQSKQYADGKLSLPMLAHMTGVDPIDVMLGLSEVGTPYRVAAGLEQERVAAFEAIEANKTAGCVVDAATYHCIRRLKLEDAVVAVCGKIGITQATADLYQARLQSLALEKSGGGSMGHREDKSRATISSDIDWLTKNADLVPARPVKDPPPVFRRLGSVKGARFFDEVYAANGSGRILLVDDLFTRQVAGLLGTPAAWLQPVLMIARNRGVLSGEQYTKAVTDLADIGQELISVDPPTLAVARKLDRDSGEEGVGRRFKAASSALGGKSADPGSHCLVAATFLDNLWSSQNLKPGDYQVTSHLLQQLLKGRTEDHQAILDVLDQQLAHRRSIRIYLRQWAKGHFLRWPRNDAVGA
jgi:Flp pilus assembly protein TadD